MITIEKVDKTNGETITGADIQKIDNNFEIIQLAINNLQPVPQEIHEYGINWNKSSDIITRLGSSIGLSASIGEPNDFSSLYPWNEMKRCNLSDIGIVNAYYGDNTYKTDGANGQCMVQIPKFWYKVINVDTNNIQFWVSDAPKEDYEVHPAFFRCRDKLCDDLTGTAIEVNYRYHHTYLPYLNGTKLESKSGVSPRVNLSLTNGRNFAKAIGNGWSLKDFNLNYAIQLLYLIEYGHFDSQTKIGRGFVDGNTALHLTGGTDIYGNSSYGEITGKYQMSYRGIEDFYGNCQQWIDGFICDSHGNLLINNKGFNNTGTGYISYSIGLEGNSIGYISDIFADKTLGFIPKSYNGSSTTKLYDFGRLYINNKIPTFGGNWSEASIAGIFYFNCTYSETDTYAYITCSLAY